MADNDTPMTDTPRRHSVNRFDPTETPESDPVPTGEDVVNRQKRGHQTPRRYDEALEKEKKQE
jgi:hypothetical protein